MTGGHCEPPREAAECLIKKANPEDHEDGSPCVLESSAQTPVDVHPSTHLQAPQSLFSNEDGFMHDRGFALALGALLAVVVLRELFLFLPILGSALWQLPSSLLLVVPGAAIGALIAATWFIPFLSYLGLMGYWGIKIVLGITFAVFLSTSLLFFQASLDSQTGPTAPSLLSFDMAPELVAQSFMLGTALVLFAVSLLLGICLLGLHKQFTETASELILGAKSFLQCRGRSLLLAVCILVNAALLLLYLIVVPLGIAMVNECQPDPQPDNNNFPDSNQSFGDPPESMQSQDPLEGLKASVSTLSAKPSCQPFIQALLPGWISGVAFGVLALFLLTWMVHLLHHLIIFVTAAVTAEDPASNTSVDDVVEASRLKAAATRALSKSFGSLCFSSLITTSIGFGAPLLRALFFVPGFSLLAPIFDLVGFIGLSLIYAVLSGYVIPGLAIVNTPLMPTTRRVCDLVLDHLPLVLVLEVSLCSISFTFYFVSYLIFLFVMLILMFAFLLTGPYGLICFYFGYVSSVFLTLTWSIVYRSSVCTKLLALGLEDKLGRSSKICPPNPSHTSDPQKAHLNSAV